MNRIARGRGAGAGGVWRTGLTAFMQALVALARLGQGVVLAPDFCVQEDVAAGRLHNLLPDWHLPIAEGDCVQALTLPVHTAGANARALVRLVAQQERSGRSAQ